MENFSLLDVRVEPALNTLTRAGRSESLPAKAIDVLVALSESPGQVLGKADLLARVWGSRSTDEKALAHAVWLLRRALNDDATHPRFIATVPRRGYRLLAPVLRDAPSTVAEPAVESRPTLSPGAVAPGPTVIELATAAPAGHRWWGPTLVAGGLAVVATTIIVFATLMDSDVALKTRDPAWTFRSAGEVLSIADEASTVLFGDDRGFVYALEGESGRERWRFATRDFVRGAPQLVGDSIYFGSDDGHLYALDALSGRERWRLPAGASIRTRAAADAEGNVLFGASDGTLSAVATVSGERRWSTRVDGTPIGDLLLQGDTVVLRVDPASLLGLDQRDGRKRWQHRLDPGASEPVRLDAAHIVIAGFNGGVAVIRTRDGSLLWHQPVAGRMQRPIADASGVVLVSTVGEVTSFASSDGRLQWRRNIAVGDAVDPVAWRDQVVVASSRSRLVFLNRGDGSSSVTLTLPAAPTLLAASQDGVRVALNRGELHSVRVDTSELKHGKHLQLTDTGVAKVPTSENNAAFRIVRIAPDVTAPELLWRAPTQGFAYHLGAIDDARLVVGDEGGLSLLESASGRVRWRYPTAQPTGTEPVHDAGILYFGGRDHHLRAIQASSGRELWSFRAGSNVLSMPAIGGDHVYFGSCDGNFYALDRRTGTELWRFPTDGPVHGAAAIGEGAVVFGSGDNHVYALDRVGGALRWRFPANNWVVATPLLADGVAYVGDASGVMHALDMDDGAERWRHECSREIWYRSAADSERIYFGCGDGHVYALSRFDGREVWRYRTEASARGGVALRDGVIFAGSSDHNLYAIDAASGKPLWRLETGGQTINPQVASGRVYVTSADQTVYALSVGKANRG